MFEIEPIANLIAAGTALQAFPETKKAIDKGLSQSVQLVFDAPKYFNKHAKDMLLKMKSKVYARLEGTPPENIVQPPPYITVPALQAITYSIDSDELHNLFANLLASSMDKEKQSLTHPAFVEIIKNMSPRDAKLLSNPILSNETSFAICDACFTSQYREHPYGFPFAYFSEGFYILKNIVIIDDSELSIVDANYSLVNLSRLGLLDMGNSFFIDKTFYQLHKNNFEKIKHTLQVDIIISKFAGNPEFDNKVFSLIPQLGTWTQFGLDFLKTCVK